MNYPYKYVFEFINSHGKENENKIIKIVFIAKIISKTRYIWLNKGKLVFMSINLRIIVKKI